MNSPRPSDAPSSDFERRSGPARGHIGLPEPRQHVARKAAAVVPDGHHHLVARPDQLDPDLARREIDRVLNEVAEPVEDPRVAQADRFQPIAVRRDPDLDPEMPHGLDDLLDEVGQRHGLQRTDVVAERG